MKYNDITQETGCFFRTFTRSGIREILKLKSIKENEDEKLIASMFTLTSDVEGLTFFETFFQSYYVGSSLSYFLENLDKKLKDGSSLYDESEVENFFTQLNYLLLRPTTKASLNQD